MTLSYGKIKRKDINSANGLLPASFSNYQIVNSGDIILRMLDLQNDKTSLRVGFVNEKGIITSAYIGLKIKNNYSSKYFYALLNHLDLIKHFYNGGGGVRQSIGFSELGKERLALPPLPEQTAIAAFLDYKTAKIDRFIRKKKQLIKLLNEQKAGIINDAVTGKINIVPATTVETLHATSVHAPTNENTLHDDVKTLHATSLQTPTPQQPIPKMKPSGIEWLGDIPEHWEIVKLTGVCGFVRGNSSFKKDELLSHGEYVALQYGKTYKVNEVDEKYQFYVNDGFYKVSQIVNYGDIIFISTSETIEDLGHSVFYNRGDLGLLGGEQILLRPKYNIVNGKYLCYSSKVFAKELKKYATGVKVFRFNINDLKTIYTCVPPINEQTAIVSYIEKETATINKTIATIEKEIALVQEYRTALIAEAVTGKIDVREYEIPRHTVETLHATSLHATSLQQQNDDDNADTDDSDNDINDYDLENI